MFNFSTYSSLPGKLYSGIKARNQKIVSLIMPNWQTGDQPNYSDKNFENYVKQGYRKNELIYSCIEATSDTTASVSLLIYNVNTDEVIRDHPLRKLLRRPNPYMTESDFWALTVVYMKLAGRAYWQKIRGPGNDVVQLWPIRPDYVQPIKSATKFIEGYNIKIPGDQHVTLPAEDVIFFKSNDPLDLYGSISPVEIASRVGDVDNALTDFLKKFMERGASPPGILTTKLKLNDTAVSDIQRRFEARYGGYQNWGKPAVLDSDATYQKIGMTLEEMQFGQFDARSETRICSIMRVPPIIVGTTFGMLRSTFSNYENARKQWWEDVLIPLYKRLGDAINNQLTIEFGEEVEARWDFSRTPALQVEATARWKRATDALVGGGITVNDFRKEVGLPDLGEAGEGFLRQLNQAFIPVVQSNPSAASPNSDFDGVDPLDKTPQPDQTTPTPQVKPGNPVPDALGGQKKSMINWSLDTEEDKKEILADVR